tara:strand:+ start:1056 stop:1721 length:666 start_codon:yes stop_codon:yes gene_type:complete
LDQFNMTKNLKKRVYTSFSLLLLFFLMLINNYILGYILIIAGIFSIMEFIKMNSIIFKKKKIVSILSNFLFIIYIFVFCSSLLIFSSFVHLKIMIFIIILTCIASDIGGFLFGKIFKGAKLTKISPNKTISGAIGSIIFSCITYFLVIFYLTNNLSLIILLVAISTSIACQVGDLFFSYLKRKSFLKDTGNLLPGHGGVLDRIDGILLGVPIGFITLLLIN